MEPPNLPWQTCLKLEIFLTSLQITRLLTSENWEIPIPYGYTSGRVHIQKWELRRWWCIAHQKLSPKLQAFWSAVMLGFFKASLFLQYENKNRARWPIKHFKLAAYPSLDRQARCKRLNSFQFIPEKNKKGSKEDRLGFSLCNIVEKQQICNQTKIGTMTMMQTERLWFMASSLSLWKIALKQQLGYQTCNGRNTRIHG